MKCELCGIIDELKDWLENVAGYYSSGMIPLQTVMEKLDALSAQGKSDPLAEILVNLNMFIQDSDYTDKQKLNIIQSYLQRIENEREGE